jgi:putative glycerol-1-phosphate prenyltransferase
VLKNVLSGNPREHKYLAVLIDPDKASEKHLDSICSLSEQHGVDFLFVGGSVVAEGDTDKCVTMIRKRTSLPVVLFPGDSHQVSHQADSILLLSLISGRNPDYLIGKHVEAAPALSKSNLEIVPTAYLLIEGGKVTAAQYVSQTFPIPRNNKELAAVTALAGSQMGLQTVYMDAGSGALNPVPIDMIRKVAETVELPIIIGGGMRTPAQVKAAWMAGASIAVVGNAFEENPERLAEFIAERDQVIHLRSQQPE